MRERSKWKQQEIQSDRVVVRDRERSKSAKAIERVVGVSKFSGRAAQRNRECLSERNGKRMGDRAVARRRDGEAKAIG